MINANELRLGNWVNEEVLGDVIVSDIQKDGSIWVEAKGLNLQHEPTIEHYHLIKGNFEPIPLSPDILLSAGFKYLKVEGVSSFEEFHNPDEDTHCWSFNVKSTDLIDSHEICLVKWGEEEYFTFQLGRGTYRKKIKYLNELQNGMFFLTGEELTIEL